MTPVTDCSASRLGPTSLSKQAELFGYNSTPPIDLPKAWVATPYFPRPSEISPPNQAILAYSAIGQENVAASALSNALVAAGVADHGVIMSPIWCSRSPIATALSCRPTNPRPG